MHKSANLRPRASLGRVLDDLGTTLLELVCGDLAHAGEIGGVVIHDPVDEPQLPHNALVLGVGLQDGADIAKVLVDLGHQRAAGLVVRGPVPLEPDVTQAVEQSKVALLGLTRGASWTQLAAMLSSLLADASVGPGEAESLGGIPSGDLFSLANAIAALVDAPITIEDRSSRVLAFSGGQDGADASRIETILGRQVPEAYTRMLTERGVFRELYRSDAPVWVDPLPLGPTQKARVVVGVRAGEEILGSIWVAVREPLSAERTEALQDAAKLVALHLLHARAGADVERRLRADLLSTAVEGGVGAPEALSRLRLADQPVVVVALALHEPADDAHSRDADAAVATERQRLADAFALHLNAVHPRSAAALLGDVTYGLLPVRSETGDGEDRAARIADEFLRRTGSRDAVVGVGSVARDAAELARSRAIADRALRVLRSRQSAGRSVARLADVDVEALLLELRDLTAARGDRPSGPIARLAAYDRQHNSQLIETLRAWLDSFGNITTASADLHVHPNTFRYRLRRLADIGGIDLANADQRFAAMLHLRLLESFTDH